MRLKFETRLLSLVLLVLVSGQVSVAQQKKLPNIVILATGGTIAGAAATGTQAAYTSGAVTIDAMLAAEAYKTNKGILEIIREKKILTEQQIKELLDPVKLTGLDKTKYLRKL